MSETIEVNTADLCGPALDRAIAQIEAIPVAIASPHYGTGWRIYKPGFGGKYSPSTDWAVGGPLIDKYILEFKFYQAEYPETAWRASANDGWGEGPTQLIAACRAIVADRLGDTVRIPAELAKQLNPA